MLVSWWNFFLTWFNLGHLKKLAFISLSSYIHRVSQKPPDSPCLVLKVAEVISLWNWDMHVCFPSRPPQTLPKAFFSPPSPCLDLFLSCSFSLSLSPFHCVCCFMEVLMQSRLSLPTETVWLRIQASHHSKQMTTDRYTESCLYIFFQLSPTLLLLLLKLVSLAISFPPLSQLLPSLPPSLPPPLSCLLYSSSRSRPLTLSFLMWMCLGGKRVYVCVSIENLFFFFF